MLQFTSRANQTRACTEEVVAGREPGFNAIAPTITEERCANVCMSFVKLPTT